MAIRIQHTVNVQVSRDQDATQKLYYPDDTAEKVITDGFERVADGTVEVAASATVQLSLGNVTDGRGLYLEMSGDCLVRLNGSAFDIPVKKAPSFTAGGARAKLFVEGTITQVEVENEGGAAITGVYVIWGNPVTP